MAPIVHGLEVEYNGKIQFVYLDIDDQRNEETKRSLGYIYQPEYYLLNSQGQVIKNGSAGFRWTIFEQSSIEI